MGENDCGLLDDGGSPSDRVRRRGHALINDLTVDQTMEAGTLVKVARREQYRPE